MADRLFSAQSFLIGGALLLVTGLILWRTLGISFLFPPYFVTAVLAMAYGLFCRYWGRFSKSKKP